MTKIISTHRTLLLLLVGIATFTGISFAEASEVTGTLSSVSAVSTESTGGLNGTVTSDSTDGDGDGSSSSGGRPRGSGGAATMNSGSVLGAATTAAMSPIFPNAGFAPEETADPGASMAATAMLLIALSYLVRLGKTTFF